MRFDVIEAYRRRDPRLLIEVTHISGEVRIIGDALQVALEVSDIDGIEAYKGRE
jgi:hypothetical protein